MRQGTDSRDILARMSALGGLEDLMDGAWWESQGKFGKANELLIAHLQFIADDERR